LEDEMGENSDSRCNPVPSCTSYSTLCRRLRSGGSCFQASLGKKVWKTLSQQKKAVEEGFITTEKSSSQRQWET
jgi:hypothetical protein